MYCNYTTYSVYIILSPVQDPSLLTMLAISNVFDLPPASKLTVLSTLINKVLSYAQVHLLFCSGVIHICDVYIYLLMIVNGMNLRYWYTSYQR